MTIETIAEAKYRAKNLREAMAVKGRALSHSQALELVAREQGARDWNTLRARLAQAPELSDAPDIASLRPGDRVEGRYMDQPFRGKMVDITSEGDDFRVSVHLDHPVDTVSFASFSNLRRRIRGTIGKNGLSSERNSKGIPHIIIEKIKQ
ncbi:hypothetical protein D6851_02065 [Altericroceibacterium spongiae]|uniref:Glyoxalase-related protein domain-containing protein n=1 Tax=Altericroceibacterium spongiae TaxID=2320269 RepID=A0A420ERI0_9SPHN|nr:glyoxalase superfamily protein [Altericroceibacterium spongiae]RKF23285.1 hypothetical protein D6851_02065 [Altericroceibacterium spongiae]